MRFLAVLALTASPAMADQATVPATPLEGLTPAFCYNAFAEGQRIGQAQDGRFIFYYGVAFYFIAVTPQGLTCEAVRYG